MEGKGTELNHLRVWWREILWRLEVVGGGPTAEWWRIALGICSAENTWLMDKPRMITRIVACFSHEPHAFYFTKGCFQQLSALYARML